MMSGRSPDPPRTSYQIVAPPAVNVLPAPLGLAGAACETEKAVATSNSAPRNAMCGRRRDMGPPESSCDSRSANLVRAGPVDRLPFLDGLHDLDILDGHGIHGERVPVQDHQVREFA